jgi:hypothetical protein
MEMAMGQREELLKLAAGAAGPLGGVARTAALALVAAMAACGLAGCGAPAGRTDEAEVVIGESTRFSQSEIEDAVTAVKDDFRGFKDCVLLELRYDEAFSDAGVDSYLRYGGGSDGNVARENMIVLESSFHVGKSASPAWNRDTDYTGYAWYLVREEGSAEWQVVDYGYG